MLLHLLTGCSLSSLPVNTIALVSLGNAWGFCNLNTRRISGLRALQLLYKVIPCVKCSIAQVLFVSLQKKDAGAEEAAAVDGSAAAAEGEMEIDAPATSAEPAVNGTATAEKKKKKKKRTAEEAALEAAPAEDGPAAEEAPKTAKKTNKAAANGAIEAPTTEKKVLHPLPL